MLLEAPLLACVILPFTCCFEFYLNWDEKIRRRYIKGRHILPPSFFWFFCSLLPHSCRSLDTAFYTSVFVCAFWDSTCLEYFPEDIHAEGRKHQSAIWCLTHWICVDMVRYYQMFFIWCEIMHLVETSSSFRSNLMTL